MAVQSTEAVQRIVASGAMECAGWLAMVAQAGLGAAILVASRDVPVESLRFMTLATIAFAYSTAPWLQAKALKERSLSNSAALTAFYEGEKFVTKSDSPNPFKALVADTVKAWTIGYLLNPINSAALLFSPKTEGRTFYANTMAQVMVGWGLTMAWSSLIISRKDQAVIDKIKLVMPAVSKWTRMYYETYARIQAPNYHPDLWSLQFGSGFGLE